MGMAGLELVGMGHGICRLLHANTLPLPHRRRLPKHKRHQSVKLRKWVQHTWKFRAQDWSDPTLPAKAVQDVEDLSQELDTKQKQRLVYATTKREEAVEAFEMLMADTLAKGVVFLQGHGDLSEENMKAVQRAKYEKVAGQLGAKVQPRKGCLWLWPVWDSSVSEARAGTSKPFQAKASPDSTVVLCFVAEKRYNESNWKKLQKTPTRFLRDWCLAVSAHASHGCHDAFGFECIDDHMVKSLMRVDNDKLSDILMAASGSRQSNFWWYVEQVGPQNASQAVLWVPCRHDDSETWVQYIDGCKGFAGSKDLVRGRYQLGYGVAISEHTPDGSSTKWVVEGLPRGFLVHDVVEFMESLDFQDVEKTEKGWRRHGNAWTVRAKRQDQCELVQGTVMDDDREYDVTIIKAVRRRVDKRKRVPLGTDCLRFGDAMKLKPNAKKPAGRGQPPAAKPEEGSQGDSTAAEAAEQKCARKAQTAEGGGSGEAQLNMALAPTQQGCQHGRLGHEWEDYQKCC